MKGRRRIRPPGEWGAQTFVILGAFCVFGLMVLLVALFLRTPAA